jgi:uncharacterized protein
LRRLTLDRRSFLAGAGASWANALLPVNAEALAKDDVLFASAFMGKDQRYGFALLNAAGDIITKQTLPDRGHAFAAGGPDGKAVIFARRPGTFAMAFDPKKKTEPVLFSAPQGSHFYGHGLFSPDGKLLYSTENQYETGDGIIGIYDVAAGFKRIGAFASGGIDPHDMVLMADGKTLCVANGGILTHPDSGRQKLNLDTMKSVICFIDLNSGALLESHQLPANLQRLSLRHMAAGASGSIWIGGQYEGDEADRPPLIARVSLGESLVLPDFPPEITSAFGNYIGSLAASVDGKLIAFTSPVGGTMLVIDANTASPIGIKTISKVCGVAASGSGFLVSTENGLMGTQIYEQHWDNHIKQVPIARL